MPDLAASDAPLDEYVTAATEGAVLGAWEPDKYKSDPKIKEKQVESFTIAVPGGDSDDLNEALRRGKIIAESQNLTRDLVNEPANKLTPAVLAEAAKQMAGEVRTRVRSFGSERNDEAWNGCAARRGARQHESPIPDRHQVPAISAGGK